MPLPLALESCLKLARSPRTSTAPRFAFAAFLRPRTVSIKARAPGADQTREAKNLTLSQFEATRLAVPRKEQVTDLQYDFGLVGKAGIWGNNELSSLPTIRRAISSLLSLDAG